MCEFKVDHIHYVTHLLQVIAVLHQNHFQEAKIINVKAVKIMLPLV